jgi:hypothetical protein
MTAQRRERRLGELARGTEAIVATKFPSRFLARTESMPGDLDASIARLGRVDLYQRRRGRRSGC